MALTPEDVVNKRFNPTKFREGYDQDEVDDFLDEVVVELRRLNQENEELRQRLVVSENRIQELQRAAQPAPGAPAQPAPEPVLAAAPAPAPAPAFAPQPTFDAGAMDPGNTNNLLQLARRLHEEHVREGMEKRDALIAEGHATAARLVSEAEQTQRQRIAAIEQQRATLERERTELERKVEELQIFEREYRLKLKTYIEDQLRELESSEAMTSGLPDAGQPASGATIVAPSGEPALASGPMTFAPAGTPVTDGTPSLPGQQGQPDQQGELGQPDQEGQQDQEPDQEGRLNEQGQPAQPQSGQLQSGQPQPGQPQPGQPQPGQPQYQPAGWGGGQPSGYPAFPQPTEYPGFGSGS